jgi:hypothetical protein
LWISPTWGDSVKFKAARSYDSVQFWGGSNQSNHSDIKFLGGFKAGDPKNKESFSSKDDHFVLVMPFGWSWNGGRNNDSTGSGSGAGKDPVGARWAARRRCIYLSPESVFPAKHELSHLSQSRESSRAFAGTIFLPFSLKYQSSQAVSLVMINSGFISKLA